MDKVNSLKDWTKLELFYKLAGPDVAVLFKITKPSGDEFVYPCRLADAGIVCEDKVVRFDPQKIKHLLGIALPRMLVGLFESIKQEGFDE